jgi:hypothetical protein
MAELAEDKSLGLTYASHQYGTYSRQKLGVWRFADRPDQKSGYWVVCELPNNLSINPPTEFH